MTSSLPYHVTVADPVKDDLRGLSKQNKRRDEHILDRLHAHLLATEPPGLLRTAINETVEELGPMATRSLIMGATQAYRLRLTKIRQSDPNAKSITTINRRVTVEDIKIVLMMLSRDLGIDFDEWDSLVEQARR